MKTPKEPWSSKSGHLECAADRLGAIGGEGAEGEAPQAALGLLANRDGVLPVIAFLEGR